MLGRLYDKEKKNLSEIGAILGVQEATVRRWLVQFSITLRSASEARKLVGVAALKGIQQQVAQRRSEAFDGDIRNSLLGMHYEENLTAEEMAKRTGYSVPRINALMAENGFKYITASSGWIRQHINLGEVLGEVWANPSLINTDTFSSDEIAVLKMRHLIETQTLEEIGEELTPPRNKQAVNRIETAAINKIRAELAQRYTS